MIVQDTVYVGNDPFNIEITEKRGEYTATIYFNEHTVISQTGEDLQNVARDVLETLYDLPSTESVTIRGEEYPIDIYPLESVYYAHVRGSEDGYGFGVDKERAVDKAIHDVEQNLGPQTLDEIGLSMDRIRALKQLEILKRRMTRGEDIDWRNVEIEEAQGEIEEMKQYYGIQNEEALYWMDKAIDRLSE